VNVLSVPIVAVVTDQEVVTETTTAVMVIMAAVAATEIVEVSVIATVAEATIHTMKNNIRIKL
jgi:hypothetical protein